LSPDRLTRIFAALVRASGLPPVTLHGLRHGAATNALAAGVQLKCVQAMLGHSTIAVTADIYTTVLPGTAHESAEMIAARLFRRPHHRRHRMLTTAAPRANDARLTLNPF
jgi:integrase